MAIKTNQMMEEKKSFRKVKRICFFLYDPIIDKYWEALSTPYTFGDGMKGRLKKHRLFMNQYRLLSSGVIRESHGGVSHRFEIKVRFQY